MTGVGDALQRFRRRPSPAQGGTANPFKLMSTLEAAAQPGEIEASWPGYELPRDIVDLWTACRAARLFEDVDYGQWGLVLLSPSASAARTAQERRARPSDLRGDDIVIGEFLGDQELVVLAPSEPGGRILIALPLDGREDWHRAAADLREFLMRYFDHSGDKYWEGAGPAWATPEIPR